VGGNSHTVTKHSMLPQTCSVLLLPMSKGVHTAYICIMNNTFYITYSGACRYSLCTVYRLCNNNAKKFYAPYNSNQQMFAVTNKIISVKLQHSFNIAALCFSTRMRKSVTSGITKSLSKYSTNFSHHGIPQTPLWWTICNTGLYPSHSQRVQHLQPVDCTSKLSFCLWLHAHA